MRIIFMESKVVSEIIITNEEPITSYNWNPPFQRINLDFFNTMDQPYSVKKIFADYETELRENLKNNSEQFYIRELKVAQKYFARCSDELYTIFSRIADEVVFTPILHDIENVTVPTANEPQNPDYNAPPRVQTMVSRIIRDTKLSRQVKSENSWKCQICDLSITLNNGNNYSEGHHLRPLGGTYEGPDIKGNIIIVCPTHHTELDYGVIAINPVTSMIEHIDKDNPFHGKRLAYKREDLDNEFLKYHYDHRFKK